MLSVQYRPYDAPTVFYGTTGGGSSGGTLLSAEEKIAELQHLVESMVSEREHVARELEEVQAEKVQRGTAALLECVAICHAPCIRSLCDILAVDVPEVCKHSSTNSR